jgi:hypothetical protein
MSYIKFATLEYASMQQAYVVRELREALRTVTPVESILVMQYLQDAVALEQKLSYLVSTMKGAS